MSIPYSRFVVGSITWYSVLIVFGILVAFWLGCREEKRLGLPADTMIDATLVAVPCGIVGSRLYYVAMEWPQFAMDPLRILYIWEGGVALYGAVIGGALGLYVYSLLKKRPFGKIIDMIAPGLLLAQAIGRWGNYFNMEAYGPAIHNPALMFFPFGVQIPEHGVYVWHMATFFYEFCWDVAAFAVLMWLRKKQKQQGNVLLWYMLLYGSGRYIIEQLRTDSLWLGGFRISQMVSLVLCLSAALMLLWRARKGQPLPLAIALAGAILAVCRWFFTGTPVYAAILALLLVAFVLLPSQATKGGKPKGETAAFRRTWLWVLIPWLVDALLLGMTQLSPTTLRLALHTVAASITLPCYVLWLQQRLTDGN